MIYPGALVIMYNTTEDFFNSKTEAATHTPAVLKKNFLTGLSCSLQLLIFSFSFLPLAELTWLL